MTTTIASIKRHTPFLTETKQTTLLGFLAGYRGFAREAYALDLRQFTASCWQRTPRLFDARRVDIECFARDLENRGISADIDALGLERGQRTLTVLRKGGKIATMPLAPRVARAVDLAVGDPRTDRSSSRLRTTVGPARRRSHRAPRRQSLDRHATYIVATFIACATRIG